MLAHKNEYTVFHLSASILKFLQYFEDFALRRLLPDYSKVDDIFYFDRTVIYYDNEQETLIMLNTLFAINTKVERRIEFDHIKKII